VEGGRWATDRGQATRLSGGEGESEITVDVIVLVFDAQLANSEMPIMLIGFSRRLVWDFSRRDRGRSMLSGITAVPRMF
jgi:hypothetical protein